MAYGLKYKLRAESVKYDKDIVIELHKKDYEGSSTNKYIGAGGISFQKDKANKICGTSLSFSIQADTDFEYIDFADSATREWLVKLYVDTVLIWQGYIIADEYREEFIDPPYDVQLRATDGLGLLKNYDYTVLSAVNDKTNRIEVLFSLLANTGLALDIEVGYLLYPITQYILWGGELIPFIDTSLTLFKDVEFYDDYFKDWTCYDVLEQILPPDCTITQNKNRWLIRRNEQDSESTHLIYTDGDPVTSTTGAGESVLNLAPLGEGDVYPIGSAELSMEYAWKSLDLKSELGKRPSFLVNHDFSNGLTGWTESVTGFADTYVTNNIIHVGLEDDGGSVSDNISQTVSNWVNDDYFALELQYALRASRRNVTNGLLYSISGEVNFRVSIFNDTDTYYLDKDDGWTTGACYITETVQSNAANMEWHDLKIYANDPPISGTMKFEIFRFHTDLINVSAIMLGVTNVIMRTLGGDDYTEYQEYEIPMRDNGTEIGSVNLIPCDVPDVDNFDKIFYNAQTTSGLTRIVDFSNRESYTQSYTNLLISSMKFLHGINRQILSGVFRGQGLHLNAIIQAAASLNRKYVVQSGIWDVLNDKYSMNLIEIPGTATGSSWAFTNTNWNGYGTWSKENTTTRKTVSASGLRNEQVTGGMPMGVQGIQGTSGSVQGTQGVQGQAGVGAQDIIWGINDTNTLRVDGAGVQSGYLPVFTANGIQGYQFDDYRAVIPLMYNPFTTRGDLLRAGTAAAPGRLAVGSEGDRMMVINGLPVWVTLNKSPQSWRADILYSLGDQVYYKDPATNTYFLLFCKTAHTSQSSIWPDWAKWTYLFKTFYHQMTTKGDTMYYMEGGSVQRIAIGNEGDIFTVVDGIPAWSNSASVQGVQGVQGLIGTQGTGGASVQGTQGIQGGSGVGTPGGSSGDVQYNSDGSFGGFANWNGDTDILTVLGSVAASQELYTIGSHPIALLEGGEIKLVGINSPSEPAAGYGLIYVNGTSGGEHLFFKNNSVTYDLTSFSESGAQGIQGTQGPAGTGTQGIQGTIGTGTQGPAGASVQGTQGTTGTGTQGATGSQGTTGTGTQGATGSQGTTGTGTQGTQGIAGSVQGTQGIQGDVGSGSQGTQGPAGSAQGIQGIQGLSGEDSSGTNAINTINNGSTISYSCALINSSNKGACAYAAVIFTSTNGTYYGRWAGFIFGAYNNGSPSAYESTIVDSCGSGVDVEASIYNISTKYYLEIKMTNNSGAQLIYALTRLPFTGI